MKILYFVKWTLQHFTTVHVAYCKLQSLRTWTVTGRTTICTVHSRYLQYIWEVHSGYLQYIYVYAYLLWGFGIHVPKFHTYGSNDVNLPHASILIIWNYNVDRSLTVICCCCDAPNLTFNRDNSQHKQARFTILSLVFVIPLI